VAAECVNAEDTRFTDFDPANLFVRSSAFHAAGGFRASDVGEDLGWRIRQHGDVALALGGRMRHLEARQPADDASGSLRLGWISTWDVPCGIASYSRFLVEALPSGSVRELTVFADSRSAKTMSRGRFQVRPSWKIEDRGVEFLAKAVADQTPDALVIQHHPGLIPGEGLAALLTDQQIINRPIVVTLHNVQHLIEMPVVQRSVIVDALQHATFVLVHAFGDLARLSKIGLARNVRLFPQGSPPMREQPPARDLPPGSAPRIGCFGFFFPHKGIYPLIQAAAIMRRNWPDLQLRLVNAAYPREDSALEIGRCRRLAAKLGLDNAIEWITDFLPDDQVLRLLGECDVVALPYAATGEASSAALRMALASGVPVAVSRAAIFDEARGVVARIASEDAFDLADGLSDLLRDMSRRQNLQTVAKTWTEHRAWPLMATRLLRLLDS
jgi:glycosyltransferase involved in cell wall biosynthesis